MTSTAITTCSCSCSESKRGCDDREETLIKDVRKLEGELADYNLALDKQRAGAHADDIMALFHHMQVAGVIRVEPKRATEGPAG